MSGDERSDRARRPGRRGPPALFKRSYRRITASPAALRAMVAGGVVVAILDLIRTLDPVPVIGYVGAQSGNLGTPQIPVISIASRAGLDPLVLAQLRPQWIAWTVGLELLKLVVVVGTVTYAFGKVFDRDPGPKATLRYGLLLGALWAGNAALGVQVSGMPVVVAVWVVLGFAFARLAAFSGLILSGHSFLSALLRSSDYSTNLTADLLGIGLVLGAVAHLAASLPVVGAIASALVAAIHLGIVGILLERPWPGESTGTAMALGAVEQEGSRSQDPAYTPEDVPNRSDSSGGERNDPATE